MTIEAYSLSEHNLAKIPLKTFDTFEDAKAWLDACCYHVDVDEDYANCADGITELGRVISIQPVGFTLS